MSAIGETRVTCYLMARLEREEDLYVSRCVGLPVVTQGETETEAMANLVDAIGLFIEGCLAKGTFEQILRKYHWTPSSRPPQDLPEGAFALPFILPAAAKYALECRG